MRFSATNTILLTALCASVGISIFAGSLTPPAGPLLPTMKTLDEVEPRIAVNAINTPGTVLALFAITQPGSYYLTGNITGVAGKSGIWIQSSGVSLDLMGFNLQGVPGSNCGVIMPFTFDNVQISNGSVRQWGIDGVDCANAKNSIVRDITASNNGQQGVFVGRSSIVERCVAESNGAMGIEIGEGSVVMDCSVRLNAVNGILTGSGCTITNCSASLNTSRGIVAGSTSTITNCSAFGNGGNGISTSMGATISECSVSFNGNDGILISEYSTVRGCTAFLNSADGIEVVGGQCLVIGNTCSSNGNVGDGAGIHVTLGQSARIEGNNVSFNDRGIDVDQAGNLIIGNSASGNTTNYDIVADNVYGPIMDRTIPGSAAVLGNFALGAVGTTNAWANFAY